MTTTGTGRSPASLHGPRATSAGYSEDFYASLSGALPKNRGKQVRKALGNLALVTAPAANLIPVAGGATTRAVQLAAAALTERTPWDKAFADVSTKLKDLDNPSSAHCRRIDRFQTDELLTLLRVVRLLGRFPGVYYLLAYDEATLFQALSRYRSPAR